MSEADVDTVCNCYYVYYLPVASRVILGNNHVFRFNHPVQGMHFNYCTSLYIPIILLSPLAREMKQKDHQKYSGRSLKGCTQRPLDAPSII